ncbi:MAG TPA: hypothetical protein VIF43_04470 [Patescibacteria group bacterium]
MTKKKEYTVVWECTLIGLPGGAGLAGGLVTMILHRRNRWMLIPGAITTALSAAYAWLVINVVRDDKRQAATQEEQYEESTVREEHELGENYITAGAILGAGLVSGTILRTSGRRKECSWLRRGGALILGLTGLFGGLVGALIASFRHDARNEQSGS